MKTTSNIARAFHAADSFYEFVATYPSLEELYDNREFVAELTGESLTDVRIAIHDNDEDRERAALEYVEEQASKDMPKNEFDGDTLVFLDLDDAEAYADQVAEKFGCISIDRQAVTDILYEYGLLLFQFFGSFRTYYRYSGARRTYAETQDLTETVETHFYHPNYWGSTDDLEIFGIDRDDIHEALCELHENKRDTVYYALEARRDEFENLDNEDEDMDEDEAAEQKREAFLELFNEIANEVDMHTDSNDEDLALEYFNIN